MVRYVRDVVLKPEKVHEDCLSLQPGQRVQNNFKLDRPGRFNLYYRKERRSSIRYAVSPFLSRRAITLPQLRRIIA